MKFYFQFDESGRVASYSDDTNLMSEKFTQQQLEITEDQYKKLKQNYIAWVCNNSLILEKPQHVITEEKQKKAEQARNQLIEKGDKITVKELKDLLLQII